MRVATVLGLVIGVVTLPGMVMAADNPKTGTLVLPTIVAAEPMTTLTPVNNKNCPVSGELIDQNSYNKETVAYQGRVYNVSSPATRRTFKTDPAKYAQIADDIMAKEKEEADKAAATKAPVTKK